MSKNELMAEPRSVTKKVATIHDVAGAAGVTAATVSRTLSGKRHGSAAVREAVLRAVEELGYQPNPHAQRLASGKSNKHIDLLSLHLNFGMDARKAQLIQGLLLARGYNAPLHAYGWGFNENSDQLELLQHLCRQRPRAIVCDLSGLGSEAMDELQRFEQDGGIVVCFGYGKEPLKIHCDQVLFDSRHSLRLAVEHLRELGHTQIGAGFPMQVSPDRGRALQFLEALGESGLSARQEWLFQIGRRQAETEVEDVGEHMAQWFLGLNQRPSAMVIPNDHAALRFVNELHHAGVSVPEDVSVIGHDDRPLARSAWVRLSSITHPADEIARGVVELLEERLRGERSGAPRHITIRGELRARQSSAPPIPSNENKAG